MSAANPVANGAVGGAGKAHLRERDDIVLRAEDVVVEFPLSKRATVHAVSGVSLDIAKGETLGVVGESGCGKSTLGRTLINLPGPTEGSVVFQGEELNKLSKERLRHYRKALQMIFQDPISSLNPRRKVRDIVREPLSIWGMSDEAEGRVDSTLEAVGLDPETMGDRRPHQFSGGQCQRISIARSLVLDPKVIVCDEPVSALDVSVQASILNLLEDMKERYGLTLVFIAHDLGVVKNISDRVAVMYLGKLCEIGGSDELYLEPAHPYTRALIRAIPALDPDAQQASDALEGDLPSPVNPPSGCRFRTRCPLADQRCADEEPAMRPVGEGHYVACHYPLRPVIELETAQAGEAS